MKAPRSNTIMKTQYFPYEKESFQNKKKINTKKNYYIDNLCEALICKKIGKKYNHLTKMIS